MVARLTQSIRKILAVGLPLDEYRFGHGSICADPEDLLSYKRLASPRQRGRKHWNGQSAPKPRRVIGASEAFLKASLIRTLNLIGPGEITEVNHRGTANLAKTHDELFIPDSFASNAICICRKWVPVERSD